MFRLRLLFLLMTSFPATLLAQENQLPRLLGEREALYQAYTRYQNQNSNFWGKKSKKDLLLIIETTEGIIRKDSEIIREVNTQALRKQAQVAAAAGKVQNQVVDDRRLNMENLYQLRQELSAARNREKKLRQDLADQNSRLAELQGHRDTERWILLALAPACFFLLAWAMRLRNQKKAVKRSTRKK